MHHLLERGDALAAKSRARISRPHRGAGFSQASDCATATVAIGGAIDSFIMDDDDGAVAGRLHIEFAHMRALVRRGEESRDGIFWKSPAGTAMRDIKRTPLASPRTTCAQSVCHLRIANTHSMRREVP